MGGLQVLGALCFKSRCCEVSCCALAMAELLQILVWPSCLLDSAPTLYCDILCPLLTLSFEFTHKCVLHSISQASPVLCSPVDPAEPCSRGALNLPFAFPA